MTKTLFIAQLPKLSRTDKHLFALTFLHDLKVLVPVTASNNSSHPPFHSYPATTLSLFLTTSNCSQPQFPSSSIIKPFLIIFSWSHRVSIGLRYGQIMVQVMLFGLFVWLDHGLGYVTFLLSSSHLFSSLPLPPLLFDYNSTRNSNQFLFSFFFFRILRK